MTRHTALVTGANRGIGLAVARALAQLGHAVVVAGRDASAIAAAAELLRDEGLDARAEVLDLTEPDSIRACATRLAESGVQISIVVNNGAIEPRADALAVSDADIEATLRTNLLGAWYGARAFVPGMIERGYGRVVNVSSDFGSFSEGLLGGAAYSVSKAALNALTVKLAQAIPAGVDVKVNALNPGWVRTQMGGDDATKSPAEGADTVVWLATLAADGPQGSFFEDRKPLGW